ncbi:DUF6339 family protein [Bacillus cereus]|nr:DUF6339 family protein [Bacillus cereus]
MNLNYMKEDAIAHLRENILNNLKSYQNDQEWVGTYLTDIAGMETWYLESRISFKKVELVLKNRKGGEISKTDAENAKLLHASLKNLTPAQAVDARIWTYLTHIVYPEYMKARWLNNKNEISKGTIARYFASTNREVIRNGIARLWWYGYLTYDKEREDPYELTYFLLSNQNIAQALLERNLGNNKKWLINILDVLRKLKEEYPLIMHSNNIKLLAKYINISGGITVLDCLDKDATEKFVREWIKNNKIDSKRLVGSV